MYKDMIEGRLDKIKSDKFRIEEGYLIVNMGDKTGAKIKIDDIELVEVSELQLFVYANGNSFWFAL